MISLKKNKTYCQNAMKQGPLYGALNPSNMMSLLAGNSKAKIRRDEKVNFDLLQ